MTIQEEKKVEGKSSEDRKLQRCPDCNVELSAVELFRFGKCFICRGGLFMTEEGTVSRETRDEDISRAWARELKIY